jgi:phthalate 4,5-dioxygenase reductase component
MADQGGLLALRIARAEPAADGIMLFELRDPAGAALPAASPGAHLPVQVPSGAMRNYSICSDTRERDRYVIAVKREEGGRGGSVSLVDRAREGDILHVGAPANLFPLVPAPAYVFVAGGIGITPILAMIHAVRGQAPFHLYYLTRARAATAFLRELSAPELAPHVTIHHDDGDPDNAFDLWPVFEEPGKAHIYCCGPRPLMDAVRDMTGHWPTSAVHFEDFGSDLVRPRADDAPFTIRLARSGAALDVPVGATILEVMRVHGLTVPSSCESGTCGTCRTRWLEGEPDHRDMVLTPAERGREIMVCVSRAKSPVLVIDA